MFVWITMGQYKYEMNQRRGTFGFVGVHAHVHTYAPEEPHNLLYVFAFILTQTLSYPPF